jgi:sugar lactone lactonase YvrE
LGWVTGVAVDLAGNIYITDGAANTVRSVTVSNGVINTIGGTFIGFNVVNPTPYNGDGGPGTEASLDIPIAVAINTSGDVAIAESSNNVIRQINSTGVISTLAGKGPGFSGYSGDGGLATAALLWVPNGVAIDAGGNVYFADSQNNVIRKVDKLTGVITTITGQGPDDAGSSGDNGPAASAKLNAPQGVAVDANGDIYIADSGNNMIRKISGGVITRIAGTGAEGYSGDGGPATSATFFAIKGIAVDDEGNVYIADSGNNVIRKIRADTGIISTIAGNSFAGYAGDGGLATIAKLSNPWGVAVDGAGKIYIADTGNSAIRVVTE